MDRLITWARRGATFASLLAIGVGCGSAPDASVDEATGSDEAAVTRSNLLLGRSKLMVGGRQALGVGGRPTLHLRTPLRIDPQALGYTFEVEALVSDDRRLVPASSTDFKLQNAWGLAAGPATRWWVANNGTSTATLYDAEGAKDRLEVRIPGSPTGEVYYGGRGFKVPECDAPARFVFASEDGTLSAWAPKADVTSPSVDAFVTVDRSSTQAIYKGLAIAGTPHGDRLYVTDFHNGRVDVFDARWSQVSMNRGAFVDVSIPRGFAPFGIRAIDGKVFVTYAAQDSAGKDDRHGVGLGFVNAYDTDGSLLFRVAGRGALNAPWGLAVAPSGFGRFGGSLLVANFGDGMIHAYDLSRCASTGCAPRGALRDVEGGSVAIDGLWAIDFGKGNAKTGETDELYFTAGPNEEANGLFGYIKMSK